MPSPTSSDETPWVAVSIDDLDAAPKGHIAVDNDLLIYFKPFHSSNHWFLGGFAEMFPSSAIALPARLYRITPDGHIQPARKEEVSS